MDPLAQMILSAGMSRNWQESMDVGPHQLYRGTMNNVPQLPKGHTSILSPRFKYVPAVATDAAQTLPACGVGACRYSGRRCKSNESESRVMSLSSRSMYLRRRGYRDDRPRWQTAAKVNIHRRAR